MSARTACLTLGSICCLAFPWSQAPGQVATDGTVGPRRALAGPDYAIGAELGSRAGGNLFHSFERFSIETGGTATFTGPNDVRNVISRVTGGTRSDIDGALRSTIPGADFFFINPAGVMFGPNASLNVQGSFHVSTADELRFSDGAVFSATNPDASSLTIATPEAFGFLGAQPAAITVDRSIVAVSPNEILELSGGDIDISGGLLFAASGTVELTAQGGDGDVSIRNQGLVSVEGEGSGRVQIRARDLTIEDRSAIVAPGFGAAVQPGGVNIGLSGTLMLTQSLIAAGSFGGPTDGVVIDAADVVLDGGQIDASSFSSGQTDGVTINASERLVIGGTVLFDQPGVSLLGFRPGIFAFARADGNAGAVTINATRLVEVREGSRISSSTSAQGNAGAVTINATGLVEVREGSQISSSTFAQGNAGKVTVTAERVLVDGHGSGINSQANLDSSGNAGAVTIDATGLVEVRNGGRISSITLAEGNAGTVTVAAGRLLVDGDGSPVTTIIASQADRNSSGDAGTVTIKATGGLVEVREGGQISSNTFGAGDAGDVTVEAGRVLVDAQDFGEGGSSFFSTSIGAQAGGRASDISEPRGEDLGNAGRVTINASERVNVRNGGVITSFSVGRDAGEVTVTAPVVLIDGAGSTFFTGINSEVRPGSIGNAGIVTVDAREELEIRDGGQITSSTLTAGDAGSVMVTADRLTLLEGGQISSSTLLESTGAGGDVQVTARESLLIAGRDTDNLRSGIFASAEGAANSDEPAGNVTVTAGDLEIRDGGLISSEALGGGDAGKVTVVADRLVLDRAEITTSSASAGGGGIQLLVRDLIDLRDSAVTTSVAGGNDPTAGNIRIDPTILIIDGSTIEADADSGSGGNVRIIADNVLVPEGDLEGLLARGEISASGATEEVDGTLAISAPEADLTGGLVVLDPGLLDAASQLRERCAARRDIGASSFTGIGRGGLPPGPDQPLMSDYTTGAAGRGEAARSGSVAAEIALLDGPTGRDSAASTPVLLVQPCAGAL